MSGRLEAHQPAEGRAIAGGAADQVTWSAAPGRVSSDVPGTASAPDGTARPAGRAQGVPDATSAPGGTGMADAAAGAHDTTSERDDAVGSDGEPEASEPEASEPRSGEPRSGEPGSGALRDGELADGEPEASEPEASEPDPLAEACRQRDEYLDALRRLQADFENYRKRVQRQQEESISRAGDRLVLSILPALDAFDLAAAHLVGDDQASPGGFIQAAALLRDTLAKEGLEQVGEVGDPFDPTAHEAVEHVEDGGESGPRIDTVLRAGYRFGGRVIRPAMVKVRG